MKPAKSYTAWVCGLCLLFSGLVASAEETSALRSDVSAIYGLLDDWNANLRHGGAWDQWHSNLSQQLATGMGGISSQLSSVLGWLNNNAGYGSNDNLKYYLQQILAATKGTGDILASNPWWSTNSEFALGWSAWTQNVPKPTSANVNHGDFTDAFSTLISARMRLRKDLTSIIGGYSYLPTDWDKTWGHNGTSLPYNETVGQVYTFEDYVADSFKSNWVLQLGSFASSYRTLTNDVSEAGFTEDHTVTNAALPQHVNVISETQSDTSAGQASASAGGQVLSAKVEELQDMLDGQKDSWITVIPEFDVGGIYVRRYEANMDTSITQACHSVMVFLWYVILFASLFNLAQTELAFYLNLGRNWTMSGGVVHGK